MIEVHIPKTWSYNATVGIWEASNTSTLGKHNELYLDKFMGKTPLTFDVDSVVLKIRRKGSIPIEMTWKNAPGVDHGTITAPDPVADNVVDLDPELAVIDGKLVWI